MKLLNIALALIIFLQLLLAWYQFRRHRRLKNHQQRMVEGLDGTRFWRVGMARLGFSRLRTAVGRCHGFFAGVEPIFADGCGRASDAGAVLPAGHLCVQRLRAA